MTFRMALFAFLFWGCGSGDVTKENFPEQYALEQCTVYKRCYRALYDGEYDNMPRCQESVSDAIRNDYETLYSGCVFSEQEAQQCLDMKSSATCEEHWDDQYTNDIYNACYDKIWDCSSNQ